MNTAERTLNVALVNMPWSRLDAPSIQCGLLKSIAAADGHCCEVHYPNLEFALLIGPEVYNSVSEMHAGRLHLLGEWLFSYAAFGEVTAEHEYFADFPEIAGIWRDLTGKGTDDLVTLRREGVPRFLREWADTVDWSAYDAVGFTSTFLQNAPSLALGRHLKERHPDLPLIYGGANFDGHMGIEYARHIDWIDYVVSGEADLAFPALLRALARREPVGIPGVHGRGCAQESTAISTPILRNLNTLPTPDYREYFSRMAQDDRSRILGGEPVKIPVEFSRGCWWGEKHHCTFCGLNALGMAYRSKSGDGAMADLELLLGQYPALHVDAVDNILDMKYFSSLCSDLAERHWDINLFFETKSNLSRAQLAMLRQAGVHRIQPGIESLSTNILELMRKGSNKLINIRLLKWARYYGITVFWNMLTGFPGETDADYKEQLDIIPALWHLQPPSGSGQIWLERFSPYYTDPSFHISNIRPRACYRHVYPQRMDHAEIAYFFDYDAPDIASGTAHSALDSAVEAWQKAWEGPPPRLIYQAAPGRITVIDQRTGTPRRAVLTGWRAAAYLACGEAPRTAERIHDELGHGCDSPGLHELESFLRGCLKAQILVEDRGKYLSLALPENPGW